MMALQKVEKRQLTTQIIVHTRRSDVIEAMKSTRLKSLSNKNVNAFTISECHASMNKVGFNGALVSFQKVKASKLKDTYEMARSYAGSHPTAIGGGCNSDCRITYS